MTDQKPKPELGLLEEDDEFEEFPAEGFIIIQFLWLGVYKVNNTSNNEKVYCYIHIFGYKFSDNYYLLCFSHYIKHLITCFICHFPTPIRELIFILKCYTAYSRNLCLPYVVSIDFWQYKVEMKLN